MTKGFRKGELVRIVMREDGCRPRGVRALTQAERDHTRQDPFYNGLDSAGEPRILPYYRSFELEPGLIVTVIRGRTKAPGNLRWSKFSMRCVLVLDPLSGHEFYIKRNLLEAISASVEGEK